MKKTLLYVILLFFSLLLVGCSNKNNYNITDIGDEKFEILLNKIPFINYSFYNKKIPKKLIIQGRLEENHMYSIKGNRIYFYEFEIKGVNKESFIPLLGGYSMDKNNIYIGNRKAKIDVNKFNFISGTINYLIDGENIYWGDKKIEGADLESFIGMGFENPINNIGYAKDKNNYYLRGDILTGTELEKYLEKI